jgi:hypothetical protein
MKKKDLIKHINESLEKGLVENLEYDFPSVQITTGVADGISAISEFRVIRREFEIKIDFVGMIRFGKGFERKGKGFEREVIFERF